MNIWKIPHLTEKRSQTFVSVIDASGSMRPFWPTLAQQFNRFVPKEGSITITFDTQAIYIPDNILSEDIFKHGGGGTNITDAFELMEAKLEAVDKDQMITCLFVSDGQDNNIDSLERRLKRLRGNQGRKMTFICLGIQSQFPTFLSMELRDLYHTGLPSIPALYLIEYYSDTALFNKFETMKEHFRYKKELSVHPPVIVFPWVEEKTKVYEGTWVLSKERKLIIEKEGLEHPGLIVVDQMLELFRGYVQELHMLSLNKSPRLKEYASTACKVMKALMNQYKEKN